MDRVPNSARWHRWVFLFVTVTLVASIVFISVAMALAPTEPDPARPNHRVKGDYVLMLAQCVLGVFALALPSMLRRRVQLEVPSNMLILYAIFLYCAIYLGEVRAFYYNVSNWDTILHTFSGAMLGALGFSFITFLNKTDQVPVNLSPVFVATFAFCFAVTLGVVWEIYEFTADGILHTNMQKFGLEDGTPFLGRLALRDTMKARMIETDGGAGKEVIGESSIMRAQAWE